MSYEGAQRKERDPGIHIERALGDDALGLREVQRDTWLSTYANERSSITPEDIDWYFNTFKKSFSEKALERTAAELNEQKQNESAFVAKDGKKIVGFVWATIHSDCNELGAIYVLPSYQGQSVGYDLWSAAYSFFDPKLPIHLTVNVHNDKAINFYERLGFSRPENSQVLSQIEFPSGATFSDIVMVRPAEKVSDTNNKT